MTWSQFISGWIKKLFNGTAEAINHDPSGAEIDMGRVNDTRPYVLLQDDIASLGEYGGLLSDLNKKRTQIAKSLHLFEGTALDTAEIQLHMNALFDDAKREAYKLATIAQQLNMSKRPDVTIKKHIKEIHDKLSKVKDSTIRENLIETANSKTKQLIELGKIAVYKARVETKVTRLEAFLGELQLGAMRAGLEENAEYQEEVAQSVKAIRSSFEVVDQYRSEVKLLEESEEKKAEEVPYYIRYKEVWSNGEEIEDPQSPATGKANGTAGETENQPTSHTMSMVQDYEEGNLELDILMSKQTGGPSGNQTPSRSVLHPEVVLSSEEEEAPVNGDGNIRILCPMCKQDLYVEATPEAALALCQCKNLLRVEYSNYRVNVTPVLCPHCETPGPFSKVTIAYSDGATRYRCGACHKYFKDSDDLVEHTQDDAVYSLNKVLSSHHRRMADILKKSTDVKKKLGNAE
jgi:uncharacterized C2H2 Zn-finger protein